MKNDSGSLIQKASFLVLLLILGCLVYLIAREEFRQPSAGNAPSTVSSVAARPHRPPTWNEAVQPSSFVPVREQTAASVRPVTNSAPVIPRVASRPPPPALPPAMVERAAAPNPAVNSPSVLPAPRSAPVSTDGGAWAGNNVGASLTGRVLLRGTPPPEKSVVLDAMCARLTGGFTTRHYVVGADGGLANVFVYLKQGAPAVPATGSEVLLDQAACQYQPYVVGVQTGQTLTVRNSDALLHNVHVLPAHNRERNIGQPVKGMTTPMLFERPEVLVKFKCDVHPWMFAYVGVVDHPWFAVTDKAGNFTLPAGLPDGPYTLAAVHQKAGELMQPATVDGGSVAPVQFVFDVPEAAAGVAR